MGSVPLSQALEGDDGRGADGGGREPQPERLQGPGERRDGDQVEGETLDSAMELLALRLSFLAQPCIEPSRIIICRMSFSFVACANAKMDANPG